MRIRLPLYARILGLFFLNVVVIAAAFVVVFRMQFHLGLDSVFATQASQRVRAVSDVVIRELQDASPVDFNPVLARFTESFGAEFYVFRVNGVQVAGTPQTLPPEVVRAIHVQGAGRGRGAGDGLGLQRGPRFSENATNLETSPTEESPQMATDAPESGVEETPSVRGMGLGPRWQQGTGRVVLPASFFIRSTDPTRYWAGTFFPAPTLRLGGQPCVLLIATDSITGGGLFFDVTPWLAAACCGLVLSALVWLPFVRSITRSLGAMTQATKEISVGRFASRVSSRRSDELGQLAAAINEMAQRLDGFVQGQRRFLGDIAHELCSPLARIQTALGILEQRASTKELVYVKDLQEEAEHMSQLVGELLSFSKASMDQSKVVLQTVVIADVVANAIRREQVEGVQIEQQIPENLTAQADAELLQRAVANLLRNAIRYAGQAGPIKIVARSAHDSVAIDIIDRGPGVPQDSVAKLFDPFYRVDESRTRETGGVGLGLTIVKTCIESCGGSVSAENQSDSGLKVTLRLKPAAPSL